jgi:hypothetical protein
MEYSVIKRFMPIKELERVPLSIGIEIEGPSTNIALSKVALEASTSDRVVILCKCKGKCNTKRCWCFNEQKRCFIHCYSGNDDHDCVFLASLALQTEKAFTSRKRARVNTAGDAVGDQYE